MSMNRRNHSPSDAPGSGSRATDRSGSRATDRSGSRAPDSSGNRAIERPSKSTPDRPGIFWFIFGRIWAIWVIILFVVTMLIIMIPFLLTSYFRSDPQKTRNFASLARIWMGVFLPLTGCPLRVRGREKFAPGQTYIVACNHNALIDVPVSYPGIPGGNKTLAKIEMARIPLFGMFYRTGSILVDRKSETSRRESINKMRDALEMGLHMCLYPEGTRNKTAEPLKAFHDGTFKLAIMTGHAIIPAVIFNSRRIMPPGVPFCVRPCPLHMHFLDPVVPAPGENIESLKQRVFDIMLRYYTAGPYQAR